MLVLSALLLAAPQADATPPPKAEPVCRRAEVTPEKGAATPSVHPLGDEPAGTQVLAVLRTEGGCIKPVVVSESVGANPRR